MRRILSLAVLAAAVLAACSGGGSVLSFQNGNTPDRTTVTVQGQSNIARVIPGGSIALSATALRGGQNGYLTNNRFKWSAELVTSGQYTINALGQTKSCNAIQFQPFPFPAAAPPPTPPPFAYDADFSIYLAIDPTNEANVLFTPPVAIPNPGPAVPPAPATPPPGAGTLTTLFPYCVVVTATPRDGSGGNAGSITVAVVNPQAPLQ